jgi:3-deoxy-D-manno-octulosonic-acid transferase
LLYPLLTAAAGVPLRAWLRARAACGKEESSRLAERRGVPSTPRPPGRLLWLHGASVGEGTAALTLIERLAGEEPDLSFLLTTGTVAAAQALAPRLPRGRAVHQYAPLDVPRWAGRFLDHWRPDAAVFLESEVWPATLAALAARRVPAALLSARLSQRSCDRWARWAPGLAARSLSAFRIVLAQDDAAAQRLRRLGAACVRAGVNLKYAAAALPADPAALSALQGAIGHRPVWLYASTHAGEEAIAARTHAALAPRLPGLLTIVAPRHPARRASIARDLAASGLSCHFRGKDGAPPDPGSALYIADTLGEMGLWFRLAPVTVVGRSLSTDGGGGHNPLEAAHLGAFPLHGPRVENLAAIYAAMDAAGAALEVPNESALVRALERFLSDSQALDAARARARAFAKTQEGGLAEALAAIRDLFVPPDREG